MFRFNGSGCGLDIEILKAPQVLLIPLCYTEPKIENPGLESSPLGKINLRNEYQIYPQGGILLHFKELTAKCFQNATGYHCM